MPYVTLKKEGRVAVISIERPEALNALSRQIIDEIEGLVETVEEDGEIGSIVFYSEKNFAAGADIKAMMDLSVEEAKEFSFVRVMSKIRKLEIPTIAAIEGYALGGGLELALTCDLRLAAETAKMGFPEINLGIMPGAGGTIAAPRLIGAAKAKELIFTGRTVSAEEAVQMGLINYSVSADSVREEALRLAKRLAEKAPVAMRMAKESIDRGLQAGSMDEGLEIELELWSRLFATEDQKEGMAAFVEKRPAQYKGK